MDRADRQFHQDYSQGHFQGHGEGQVQSGFDTFVMTGDMIIRTTPKLAAPSTRLKSDKPASTAQIGDHTSADNLSRDLPQPSFNGGVEIAPTETLQVEVAGYPRFPDIPVELDIPPDDISSDDERHRIDCLEELDVTNLPPPPDEFLGDFADTAVPSATVGAGDGEPVWQISGLPVSVGQSENWRSSLDEAILRLETNTTASSETRIHHEVPSRHGPVDHAAGLGTGLNAEKVLSAGRANSSGSLVSTGAGVRASKSQENWLQCGGSDVGFVNIDVDRSSASVEALHCALPTSLDNLDTLKSSEAVPLRQSADDVRRPVPGVSDNSELSSKSAAKEKSTVDSVEDNIDSSIVHSSVEPSADYCQNPSPEHASFGGFEESRHSSGQRLLGGGKGSPVQRSPPFQNGTESFAELNHHGPASWNNVTDSSRPQLKDVDHPSACRLAKRLYHLEGFRKSDVSKHLSKKYTCLSFTR